jgi:hypothetical protein
MKESLDMTTEISKGMKETKEGEYGRKYKIKEGVEDLIENRKCMTEESDEMVYKKKERRSERTE